ncbi:MAG: 3-deoxy-manno-octulosonate cytidylyltransferase [Synergistaceae bacterium]|jgi:3-deoxy-manno-octulosonate cytidylyltransferase (CMP-KDO synthetase)|nr:3-deoxy-manno-octulosonate cytidylyltransferase [Synergistaceae bacterium]
MTAIETLAVIPARLGSRRLHAKPLIKLLGRELVLWVLNGVMGSRRVGRTVVATDDESVVSVVESAGGEAMMTPSDLPTGTDRVAYVAERIPSRFVLGVQCDDPMTNAGVIDPMIDALASDDGIGLALLAKRIDDPGEMARDSIVKVVFGLDHNALYFSRSPIPFVRGPAAPSFKHIGPYAWRREALFRFASRPQTPLEISESLEMLRMLEHGETIKCIETETDSIEIDTPEDSRMFEERMRERAI